MGKDAKIAEGGQAEEGILCPDGSDCRFANPALEEVARQVQASKR